MDGGFVQNLGASPTSRKYLFYLICIPIRLLIVSLAFKYEGSPMFIPVSIMISLISIMMNMNKSKVWWDRDIHLLNAISVLLVAIAGYPKYIKYILVSDVAHGVFSSVNKKPWG